MSNLKDLDTIISETIDISDLGFLDQPESNVDMNAPNIAPYQRQAETLSFNNPILEKEEVKKSPVSDEPSYINQRIFIDKFNEKVIRVEITPSVCTVCGFDIAAKRHGRWGLVPVEERAVVEQALALHKRDLHTLGDLHIVKKSELPKQWLGTNSF